jgi:uncharacterized repeat protein (TIGR03803 family)
MKTFKILIALAGATLLLAATANTQAQFTLLHSFAGPPDDGSQPSYNSLTLSGSTLYGMTSSGGSSYGGTIFKIDTNGTGHTVLHNFTYSDGNPFGSLTLAGSTLYGMTQYGGSSGIGTIFKIGTDGSGYTNLHSFAGGAGGGSLPWGSLTLSGSTLYGMTEYGGSSNSGVVFQVNTDGTGFELLHSFAGSTGDGAAPLSTLTLSGSTLYGMTFYGRGIEGGTIFKINTDGTGYTNLHIFTGSTSDGSNPYGSLTLAGSTLYGMTLYGGSTYGGTVFKINTDGNGYTNLHSFVGGDSDGRNPFGSLTLSGSTLYGMTCNGGISNNGTVFQVNADGTGFQLLHSFVGGTGDGRMPEGSLTLSNSTLYGMAYYGGTSNLGVIFSLTLPPPSPPVIDSVTVSNALATVGGNTIVAAGDNLGFTVNAHPANSLSYRWDFGDGSNTAWSLLNTATHAYSTASNCSPYTVTATVSNETASVSSNLPIIVACQLTVTKLQVKVNLNPAKSNADNCKLTGTLALEPGFSVTNKAVTVDIGGAQVSFTLNAKGRGTSAPHTCKLSYNKKTKLWTFTATLKKGSWATPWSAHGLANVTTPKSGVTVTLPVMLVIGDEVFADEKSLLYKATAGRSGSAK